MKRADCNRCGKCCENFDLGYVDFGESTKRNDSANFKEGIVEALGERFKGKDWLDFVETVGVNDVRHGLMEIGVEGKAERLSFAEEERRHGSRVKYRCNLFKREESTGEGICSVHAYRPEVCERYRPSESDEPGGYLNRTYLFHEGCSYLDWYLEE